jgi:hypothetical protein
MAHSNLPTHLLKSLQLPSLEKCNIYLVGSRLWGTNSDTSDWDLLIVSDLSSGQLKSLHKCQYDITLLDRQEFAARVNQGSIVEVACALLRKEDMLSYAFDTTDLQVNLDAMKMWLEDRQVKDFDKAKKFWLKGNQQSGWKILRHVLNSKALYNHLATVLSSTRVTLTIHDVQTVARSTALLHDKNWIQLDWVNAYSAVTDALTQL